MRIICEVLSEALIGILYFVEKKLATIATFFEVILPFIMLFVGEYVMLQRGDYKAGGELFIPLLFGVIIYLLRKMANKLGKGTTMPMPTKRFTSIDEDECVSMEQKRIQELLIYMNDLEDWLEHKGYK